MSDETVASDAETRMEEARMALQRMQQRMASGEAVDEEELQGLAQFVATLLQTVQAQLAEMVGPIDFEKMKEEMRKRMSADEYQNWLAGEIERRKLRDEVAAKETEESNL